MMSTKPPPALGAGISGRLVHEPAHLIENSCNPRLTSESTLTLRPVSLYSWLFPEHF